MLYGSYLSSSIQSRLHLFNVLFSIFQDEEKARQANGDSDSRKPSSLLMDPSQQQQMMLYRDQTDAYLAARHDTVRTIEHTIVELGEIFQQLATMVRPLFFDQKLLTQ